MTIEHPVENLMRSTMENLRDMIDVNTVIGEAVETKDGSFIIPISKVTFGFASGGSEFAKEENHDSKLPFGGGSGAGVTVKPVAFLVVREDAVRLLPVDSNNSYDRLIDSIPSILNTFKGFFDDVTKKKNKSQKEHICSSCNCNIEECLCDDSDSSSVNIH
ncbi:GerW family sporulation protein [Clostridium sp.]|uniref:GerW family sporulation protein n=1 Tax=Clostridium sp. TaxID=1506 RepID=UPI003F3BE272